MDKQVHSPLLTPHKPIHKTRRVQKQRQLSNISYDAPAVQLIIVAY